VGGKVHYLLNSNTSNPTDTGVHSTTTGEEREKTTSGMSDNRSPLIHTYSFKQKPAGSVKHICFLIS